MANPGPRPSKVGASRHGALGIVCRVGIGAAIVALVALPLVPVDTDWSPGLWRSASYAAHVFVFAAACGLAYAALAGLVARPLSWAVALAFAAAVAVEVGQVGIEGRSASWADLFLGALGIGLSASAVLLWRARVRTTVRAVHGAVALVVACVVAAPVVPEVEAVVRRAATFPVLGRFEHAWELRVWRAADVEGGNMTDAVFSAEHAREGRQALRVETTPGYWSGVVFAAGFADWRGYDGLRFDVYNPDEPFELRIRVEDAGPRHQDHRYNGRRSIDTGWNALRIPVDEIRAGPRDGALGLDRIVRLHLYVPRELPERVWFLDDVRLEGPAQSASSPSM